MPEWLVERGIGETRAILVNDGEILEARIELDGIVRSGTHLQARVRNVGINNRNAILQDEQGLEYLLPRGTGGAPEGRLLTIEVTREAIPGSEPWKRPRARIVGEMPQHPRGTAELAAAKSLTFPSPNDQFAGLGWNDLLEEARNRTVRFAGGELLISATPAMTLVDVDGHIRLEELAALGAMEAARAIRRLDIGGSIGIDLPTISGKGARQAAAAAIDSVLPKPFERTSVNGFGFVQIVRPRFRASLVELAQDTASFEARALLRRVAVEPPGRKRLIAHPAVIRLLETQDAWIDDLVRQAGGGIELRSDASLPISGGYAQGF